MSRKTYHPYKASSAMESGPHPLTVEDVYGRVSRTHGIYLLVSKGEKGSLIVTYVGRSEALVERLAAHIGEGHYIGYYYKYANSRGEAFEFECEEFHRYGEDLHLDNDIHPARPAGYRGVACSDRGCPTR